MVTIAPLPEGTKEYLNRLMEDGIEIFKRGNEPQLVDWGQRVHTDFNTPEVQAVMREALDGWESELSEGPRVQEGFANGNPVAYSQLLHELKALYERSQRPQSSRTAPSEYDVIDHSFDLGEIALGSLKDALENYPHAKAIISIIKELVQMAKAINRRLKSGW